jgi:WD40 repeat protein
MKVGISVLACAAVGVATFGFFTLRQEHQARASAAQRLAAADSRELAQQSESADGAAPQVAAQEAVTAWRLDPSDEAQYAMLDAAAQPGFAVLDDPGYLIESMAFDPDGKILVTGAGSLKDTDTGMLQFWSTTTGRPVGGPLITHTGPVIAVAFSPNGEVLATGTTGQQGRVQLWNAAKRTPIASPISREIEPVLALAFSPDGRTLAVGTGGQVQLWNLGGPMTAPSLTASQPITKSVEDQSGVEYVDYVAFSKTGLLLTDSIGSDQLWYAASLTRDGPLLTQPTETIPAFSPHGKLLATGAQGTESFGVRLWDVATRTPIPSPLSTVGPESSVAFSPGGETLAIGGVGTVQLWSVATGQPISGLLSGQTGLIKSVAFSPDGATLASVSDDGTVRLWNVAAIQPVANVAINQQGSIEAAAFSPDGGILAAGFSTTAARVWQTAAPSLTTPGPLREAPIVAAEPYSPAEGTLVFGKIPGAAGLLWNVDTGPSPASVLALDTAAQPLAEALSAAARTLAISLDNGDIQMYSLPAGLTDGATIHVADGTAQAIALGANADRLAAVTVTGEASLWAVRSGRLIASRQLSGGSSYSSIAISSDGHTVAIGGLGEVEIWNVPTGQLSQLSLSGESGTVHALAFSPDGTVLATGTLGGTAQLWDLRTGQPIGGAMSVGEGAILSLAFGARGATLAAGDMSGTVEVWNVGYLTDPLQRLCAQAGSLTPAEWPQYVRGGAAYQLDCPNR